MCKRKLKQNQVLQTKAKTQLPKSQKKSRSPLCAKPTTQNTLNDQIIAAVDIHVARGHLYQSVSTLVAPVQSGWSRGTHSSVSYRASTRPFGG